MRDNGALSPATDKEAHSNKIFPAVGTFISVEVFRAAGGSLQNVTLMVEAYSHSLMLGNRPKFHFRELVGIFIPDALVPDHAIATFNLVTLQIPPIQVGEMAVIEPPAPLKGLSTVLV